MHQITSQSQQPDNSEILPTHPYVKSAIHISFLDYTLFPEYPEFHSVYKLKNDKNSMIYTDKFMIHVINLTCIDLATEEDRFYGIDQWA